MAKYGYSGHALHDLKDGEQRFRTIGAVPGGVVFVARTLHEISEGEELVRITPARYATPSERKAYEEDSH
jgi:uncharacterized DUF497 family protein